MSKNVYELGTGTKTLENGKVHPFSIGIVEGDGLMFFVHQGSGFTDAGGFLGADSLAIDDRWNEHFEYTGLNWLRDLLIRHELGDEQTFETICIEFENINGFRPKLNPYMR